MRFMQLAVVACILGIAVADKSPVIVWSAANIPIKPPALHTVSQEAFSEIVTPLLADHMIVAFQEENLGTEDFHCTVSATRDSCYAHLRKISPKTYYASVDNPVEVLNTAASEIEFNRVDFNGELKAPISCAPGKVVFVDFANGDSRAANLEAHDAAMQAISKEKDCPTAYMYLSASSTNQDSHSRLRRSTAAPTGGYIFRATNQLLLFFTQLLVIENGGTQELTVSSMTVTADTTNTKLSVSLTTSSKPVTFDVIYSAGYYNVSNMMYNDIAFFTYDVNAPTTFSYYCGNLTLPAQTALTATQLKFNSFQIQAPFSSSTPDTFVFGNSWNCVGFVTSGIVMGLFVVALFLIIIFTGICWMMDINTMDRFDDPKGKTITINAGE